MIIVQCSQHLSGLIPQKGIAMYIKVAHFNVGSALPK